MSIASPIYQAPLRSECRFQHKSLEFDEWHVCRVTWAPPPGPFADVGPWDFEVEWFGVVGRDIRHDLEAQAFTKLGIMVAREARAQVHAREGGE